jgi:hypothetical protein
MEAQVRPLIMAIPKFIQLGVPLPLLKPMDQSRHGVTHSMEAQAHRTRIFFGTLKYFNQLI